MGGSSFIAVQCVGAMRAYARREGGREVMAQLGAAVERACSHAAQSATRAAMVGASMEATLKGVLSVRRWRGGELDRGRSNVAT
jgi:hypothetical protein